MPEPNVLYTVTAVVVAGLVLWVAYVLKTAKEPWERKLATASPGVPPEGAAEDEAKDEATAGEEKAEEAEEAEKAEKAEPEEEPGSDEAEAPKAKAE